MRLFSLIALITATASPALANTPPINIATDSTYSARDTGDRLERAKIFETSELFGSERAGDPRTRARDTGDRKENAKTFDLSELSAQERHGLT
ncbi:hypothetical protein G5B38_15755 [Pseudohalocynthiibacter aestuariivivens]|uniref:Uncharacterized protein n=1 Tax=Roseovarius pelagicus TaxID=2980108 RepID=A0ABY6DEL2_9RHOB|nr:MULTISPECIES: hypothetical protein [Rhodobacterales]QIE46857.1 hypothetical protein G5B38_15755 [Pseudohalocynthiibacter aestuariivivens]UXX84597.1 hypothetical protein N7U68_08155 [Roseovarius pelagicus]